MGTAAGHLLQPLLQQGQQQLVAQGFVQLGFEYLHWWRLYFAIFTVIHRGVYVKVESPVCLLFFYWVSLRRFCFCLLPSSFIPTRTLCTSVTSPLSFVFELYNPSYLSLSSHCQMCQSFGQKCLCKTHWLCQWNFICEFFQMSRNHFWE